MLYDSKMCVINPFKRGLLSPTKFYILSQGYDKGFISKWQGEEQIGEPKPKTIRLMNKTRSENRGVVIVNDSL